jgi:hypothetical protein
MSKDSNSFGVLHFIGLFSFAIIVMGCVSDTYRWLVRYHPDFFSTLIGIGEVLLIIGGGLLLIWLAGCAIESITVWVRGVSRRLTSLEEHQRDQEERLDSCSRINGRINEKMGDLVDITKELRKFTHFDEEMERRKKLKEAMASVGAKEVVEPKQNLLVAERELFGGMTEAERELYGEGPAPSESY